MTYFSTFTMLFNDHPYLVPKHFITPKKDLPTYQQSLPTPSPPALGNHQAAFCLYGLVVGHFT